MFGELGGNVVPVVGVEHAHARDEKGSYIGLDRMHVARVMRRAEWPAIRSPNFTKQPPTKKEAAHVARIIHRRFARLAGLFATDACERGT